MVSPRTVGIGETVCNGDWGGERDRWVHEFALRCPESITGTGTGAATEEEGFEGWIMGPLLELLFSTSSSLNSLASSISTLLPFKTSLTYDRDSNASRLRFCRRCRSSTSVSSCRSTSTIHPRASPSCLFVVRKCEMSRSISNRVRGSQGGRSSGGLSSVKGKVEKEGLGERPSDAAKSGILRCK